MIESMSPWALPLAVFIPTLLVVMLGIWGVRTVLRAMEGISKQILAWHGSQESVEAHKKMWQQFMESDYFRERMATHIKMHVDIAVNPMIAQMSMLEKSVQTAVLGLSKEVRDALDNFRREVLTAVINRVADRTEPEQDHK